MTETEIETGTVIMAGTGTVVVGEDGKSVQFDDTHIQMKKTSAGVQKGVKFNFFFYT